MCYRSGFTVASYVKRRRRKNTKAARVLSSPIKRHDATPAFLYSAMPSPPQFASPDIGYFTAEDVKVTDCPKMPTTNGIKCSQHRQSLALCNPADCQEYREVWPAKRPEPLEGDEGFHMETESVSLPDFEKVIALSSYGATIRYPDGTEIIDLTYGEESESEESDSEEERLADNAPINIPGAPGLHTLADVGLSINPWKTKLPRKVDDNKYQFGTVTSESLVVRK